MVQCFGEGSDNVEPSIQYRRNLNKVITVEGNAAEIGVAEGNYAMEIAAWPCAFPIVYLVDRWAQKPGQKGDGGFPDEWHEANLKQVQDRIAAHGMHDRVRIVRGDSRDMASYVPDESLAFCYIDCDHSYLGCLNDIVAWWPKVKAGGVMAFHDYLNPSYGVRRAVQDAFDVQGAHFGVRKVHEILEDKDADAGAWVRK